MHVNEDRRARLAGAIDIELFDIGRTIGQRRGTPMRARAASLLLARRWET